MKDSEEPSVARLRTLYGLGTNIAEYLRDHPEASPPGLDSVTVSYDLQAGSYIASLKDAEIRRHKGRYGKALAQIINDAGGGSLLEAGIGEATTLRFVLDHLQPQFDDIHGIDISWSRLAHARRFLQDPPDPPTNSVRLAIGDLAAIPFPDNRFDVVFTSHAIEPNRGKERLMLEELYRVSARALILLEPGYELAPPGAKQRMDFHGYCRDLPETARDLGYDVREHRLFEESANPLNPTALTVIIKERELGRVAEGYACPHCRKQLAAFPDVYYCRSCLFVYPSILGIPCLAKSHAILATAFEQFTLPAIAAADNRPLGKVQFPINFSSKNPEGEDYASA